MTLATLLRRAERAMTKAQVVCADQRYADYKVRAEAGRLALAALARKGIGMGALIAFTDPIQARWYPDPLRLNHLEAYPGKRFTDSAPCWRVRVTCTGFCKDGRPRTAPSILTFDLDHPRDIARQVVLVKSASHHAG